MVTSSWAYNRRKATSRMVCSQTPDPFHGERLPGPLCSQPVPRPWAEHSHGRSCLEQQVRQRLRPAPGQGPQGVSTHIQPSSHRAGASRGAPDLLARPQAPGKPGG